MIAFWTFCVSGLQAWIIFGILFCVEISKWYYFGIPFYTSYSCKILIYLKLNTKQCHNMYLQQQFRKETYFEQRVLYLCQWLGTWVVSVIHLVPLTKLKSDAKFQLFYTLTRFDSMSFILDPLKKQSVRIYLSIVASKMTQILLSFFPVFNGLSWKLLQNSSLAIKWVLIFNSFSLCFKNVLVTTF